ncbi:hypothetical protein TKK_0005577 [Trichogramma kaykai]
MSSDLDNILIKDEVNFSNDDEVKGDQESAGEPPQPKVAGHAEHAAGEGEARADENDQIEAGLGHFINLLGLGEVAARTVNEHEEMAAHAKVEGAEEIKAAATQQQANQVKSLVAQQEIVMAASQL